MSDSDRQDTRAQGSCMAHAARASAWLVHSYWLLSALRHEDSLHQPTGLNILKARLQLWAPSSPSDVSPASRSFSPGLIPPCCVRAYVYMYETNKTEIHSALLFMGTTVIAERKAIETCLLRVTRYHWLYLNTYKEAAIVGFGGLRRPL